MLSPRAIDRVFERLALVYGRDFAARLDGLPLNAVKSEWCYVLDGFGEDLASVAWALDNLPERAPNAIEFRNLCRRAPTQDLPQLAAPQADPARMRAELAKLHTIVAPSRKAHTDYRAWARRLIESHEAGAYRSTPAALKMAREALGLQ